MRTLLLHFDVVAGEDALSGADLASPPVVLTVGPLDDGDNLALFEAEVASLVRVKVVHCDSLILLEQRLLGAEVGFGS